VLAESGKLERHLQKNISKFFSVTRYEGREIKYGEYDYKVTTSFMTLLFHHVLLSDIIYTHDPCTFKGNKNFGKGLY
jgi:hypothetical protein